MRRLASVVDNPKAWNLLSVSSDGTGKLQPRQINRASSMFPRAQTQFGREEVTMPTFYGRLIFILFFFFCDDFHLDQS
ncbi:MAG: hypothetical protein Q8P67_13405 [archaeon]|nr:hypothetical protein [archaeon]